MRLAAIGVVVIADVAWFAAPVVSNQLGRLPPARCLHDEDETQPNRVRREQAMALARVINAAQGRNRDQIPQYQLLPQPTNLPTLPDGFAVRLDASAGGYIFSIKDTRDPCRFGIFSDHQGTVYDSSPTVPLIAS
jgi:hypothetical protein